MLTGNFIEAQSFQQQARIDIDKHSNKIRPKSKSKLARTVDTSEDGGFKSLPMFGDMSELDTSLQEELRKTGPIRMVDRKRIST